MCVGLAIGEVGGPYLFLFQECIGPSICRLKDCAWVCVGLAIGKVGGQSFSSCVFDLLYGG